MKLELRADIVRYWDVFEWQQVYSTNPIRRMIALRQM